jgi:predicted DCC family thiol-disulfide oxidoreductase YuxK
VNESEPILVFDGRCGFCTRSVEWLLERLREPVRAVPWQSLDLERYALTEGDVRRAAWWIEPDGRRWGGHRAAARALRGCGGAWAWLGWLMRVPPFAWIAAIGYWLIARNRRLFPGTTPACKRGHWNGVRLPPR